MKRFILSFSLTMLFTAAVLRAQKSDTLSRFTYSLELGTGIAGHDCCSYMYGYYKVGGVPAYRVSRQLSLAASLYYLRLEGSLNGYSNGATYQLSGFQQWHNAVLMFGPALHLPFRNGFEWSLEPKAGFMLNRVSQEISNYGLPYQNRVYKPGLLPAYEADLRVSWWFTNRLAFETSLGYFANLDGSKPLTLNSAKGTPAPGNNQELPEPFLFEIGQRNGRLSAINLHLGLRFRL